MARLWATGSSDALRTTPFKHRQVTCMQWRLGTAVLCLSSGAATLVCLRQSLEFVASAQLHELLRTTTRQLSGYTV